MLRNLVHAAAACSPTRAMLLSGTDNHLNGMGVMAEGKATSDDKWYTPGYEGYMSESDGSKPCLTPLAWCGTGGWMLSCDQTLTLLRCPRS